MFLNISKDEQRHRLQKRLDNPDKNYKWDPGDLADREKWDDYRTAYEETLTETSTPWAPWYVVPGDRKWVRDVAVGQLLVDTLRRMDPQPPQTAEDIDGVVVT